MGTTATTSAVLARRRSYHVGNVRSQLSSAASALLESEGASALSLRAIARRTGVALGTVWRGSATSLRPFTPPPTPAAR